MYLENTRAVENFVDGAHETRLLGLDAEFIHERTYYPRLALVQIVVSDRCALIDPLQVTDLAPLEKIIGDPEIAKVLHAGSQDLRIFFNRTGEVPRNIFDTQLAAAMVGIGAQIGYGPLVEQLLGVTLAKAESFTDWLQRPLTDEQETYALDDVRYLLPLHETQCGRLDELGRRGWVAEEFERYEDRSFYAPEADQLYRKVKRFGTLDPRGQAVLRELARWREEEARTRDKPRGWVVPDEALLEIARRRPNATDALRRIRSLKPQTVQASADDILATVKRGIEVPDEDCPRDEQRLRLDASTELVGDFLNAYMKSECQAASISPGMVGTSSDVQCLLRARVGKESTDSNPLTTGWRGELVGRKLEAFLAGKISVRIDPQSLEPVFEPTQ